jgi:hypothetical protein
VTDSGSTDVANAHGSVWRRHIESHIRCVWDLRLIQARYAFRHPLHGCTHTASLHSYTHTASQHTCNAHSQTPALFTSQSHARDYNRRSSGDEGAHNNQAYDRKRPWSIRGMAACKALERNTRHRAYSVRRCHAPIVIHALA